MSSSQRPDTLMQDRICQIDENLLHPTAGPFPLPTGIAWRCNMSRRAKRRRPATFAACFVALSYASQRLGGGRGS
jgi:hypothetical protein